MVLALRGNMTGSIDVSGVTPDRLCSMKRSDIGAILLANGERLDSMFVVSDGDPRELVIWATTNCPASSRPSQAGTRSGGLAPATWARYGSQSATGAGSLSTTL